MSFFFSMTPPFTRPSVSPILSTPAAHPGSRGRRLVAILLRSRTLEPGLWLASPARHLVLAPSRNAALPPPARPH
jgi:hypothetical protein